MAHSCKRALLPVERLEGGLADALRQAPSEGRQHAQRPGLHSATSSLHEHKPTCLGGIRLRTHSGRML